MSTLLFTLLQKFSLIKVGNICSIVLVYFFRDSITSIVSDSIFPRMVTPTYLFYPTYSFHIMTDTLLIKRWSVCTFSLNLGHAL